jgi:hypothetical protein
MRRTWRKLLIAGGVAACLFIALPGDASPPAPGEAGAATPGTLYTKYVLVGGTGIGWTRCGTATGSYACFGSGTIAGFDRPCALLEGSQTAIGSTISNEIYVLDSGGRSLPYASLRVFKATSTVLGETVSTQIDFEQSVRLPIPSSPRVACLMAANQDYIYVGTSESAAIPVKRSDFSLPTSAGYLGDLRLITVNNALFGVITYGPLTGFGGAFGQFNPTGQIEDYGGGAAFLPTSINAVILP